MADRESDLREEQAWTSQQLDATYARMSALWDQKQQLESQIESLNSDLVNVMVSIQTLESDIASKEAEIEKTQYTTAIIWAGAILILIRIMWRTKT